MMDDPIVIVGMARTPMGGFQGALKDARAPELGSAAIEAALSRAGVAGHDVDEVIMGNILSAGQGQAPARQAAIGAGVPEHVGCTTINKMCGSGMKATMFAHDLIAAGSGAIVVAGGMESMTNAPYLLDRARSGYRMGHGQVQDHMFLDGLEDAYDKGTLMGHFAEETARTYQFTREQQDEFAITSLTRAKTAIEDGSFDGEVTPVTVKHRKGETVVAQDEQPLTADFDKIPTLRPAFAKDGSVTAANSSSISDGGAALVLMRRTRRRGARAHAHRPHPRPRDARAGARLVHHRAGAGAPQALREGGLGCRRRGPLRDQRGLRRRRHGGDARPGPPPREGERPRRRLCARPSGRRLRRAYRHHAPGGAGEVRPRQGRSRALHRRRRGHGARRRAPPLGRLP